MGVSRDVRRTSGEEEALHRPVSAPQPQRKITSPSPRAYAPRARPPRATPDLPRRRQSAENRGGYLGIEDAKSLPRWMRPTVASLGRLGVDRYGVELPDPTSNDEQELRS